MRQIGSAPCSGMVITLNIFGCLAIVAGVSLIAFGLLAEGAGGLASGVLFLGLANLLEQVVRIAQAVQHDGQ